MTHTEKVRNDALERLRDSVKPGDTVYTVLRHVSRSGMSRAIDAYAHDEDGAHVWLSPLVAKVTGYGFSRRYEALTVTGCGMDMGFELVYTLSHALYPDYPCVGEQCPSNAHSGRDAQPRVEGAQMHRDGYALRHRWI